MARKQKASGFAPDYAVHPGKTLEESLVSTGMTQSELATRSGLSRKTINGIVNGREPITPETAIHLEKVFHVPARFWTNLQANHDETLARLREQERLSEFTGWVAESGVPYKTLEGSGHAPSSKDKIAQLDAVLKFFGVSSPDQFVAVWEECEAASQYRRSGKHPGDFGPIATWLRLGELEAQRIECRAFDSKGLTAALPEMRALTMIPCEEFESRLAGLCARHGVALVFVPGIKGAPIYGATRWLTPTKAIVQLSLRGKDDGNFWFTFFHEIGHVLLHGKSSIFLELDKAKADDREEEANAFARDLLIPPERLDAFLANHPRTNRQGFRVVGKEAIRAFATSIGVAPGVVVGRLQRDKVIPYTHCNDLKKRFEFCGEAKG